MSEIVPSPTPNLVQMIEAIRQAKGGCVEVQKGYFVQGEVHEVMDAIYAGGILLPVTRDILHEQYEAVMAQSF